MKIALTKTQLAVILATISVTVLLCIARKTPDKLNDVAAMASSHAGSEAFPSSTSSARNYLDSSLLQLDEKDHRRVAKLIDEAGKTSSVEQLHVLDQLVAVLDTLQKPAASAFFMQLKARQTNDKADWSKTAERYYVGSKYFPAAHILVDSAIHAFGKVLALDPDNLSAKTGLGVCYVEGTQEPMKGISLLQEVLRADSNYVDALLNLGSFAMTSGQYQKAITRFEKVLKLKPQYILLYVRIAEAYEKMGNKEKTIEYLEKYVKKEDDVMLRTSIQNEINKLKTS